MAIKLVGLVLDIFQAQGHSEELIEEYKTNRGFYLNKPVILADLPRTALVDFNGSHQAFLELCQNDRVYAEHYLQGNLDGGSALDIYDLYYHKIFAKMNEEADSLSPDDKKSKQQEASQFQIDGVTGRKFLRFAFPDDDGNMCCLGLVFNVLKPDHWAIQMTQNTLAPLNTKKTYLIAEGDFVQSDQGIFVASEDVASDLTAALNSRMTSQLISGLVNSDGTICIEKFNQLKDRLIAGSNIDRRDIRQTLLEELFQVATNSLPECMELRSDFCGISLQAATDPDFYKDGNFEKNIFTIHDNICRHIMRQTLQDDVLNRMLFENAASMNAILLHNMAISITEASQSPLRKILQEQANILRSARDDPKSDYVETVTANALINRIPAYADSIRKALAYYDIAQKQINGQKPVAPEFLTQNFFERNKLTLISGIFFLLAGIGFILVLTGVIAPIGLVFSEVIVALLGVASAAVTGMSLGAAALLAYNESGISREREAFLLASDRNINDVYICQRLQKEALNCLQSDFLKENISALQPPFHQTTFRDTSPSLENVTNDQDLEQIFFELESGLSEAEKMIREGRSRHVTKPVAHNNFTSRISPQKTDSDDLTPTQKNLN